MAYLHWLAAAALAFTLTTPASAGGHSNARIVLASETMQKDDMGAMQHELGDLRLIAPFARATVPNQPVAGAFLQITNTGTEDDVLISVATEISGRAEIHEMAMDGDTMRMRQLPDGLVIPAGETVELKPGGYHLMFMKLNGPLVQGEMLDVTLEFQNAGSITMPFSIQAMDAKKMDHGGQDS